MTLKFALFFVLFPYKSIFSSNKIPLFENHISYLTLQSISLVIFVKQKASTYTSYVDNVKSTFSNIANGAISAMKSAVSQAKSVVNGVSPSTYTGPINTAIT